MTKGGSMTPVAQADRVTTLAACRPAAHDDPADRAALVAPRAWRTDTDASAARSLTSRKRSTAAETTRPDPPPERHQLSQERCRRPLGTSVSWVRRTSPA